MEYSVLVLSAGMLVEQFDWLAKVTSHNYSSAAQRMMATNVDRAIEVACRRLGYVGLKPQQEKAVKSFVSGRDVLPTGSAAEDEAHCVSKW